MLTQTSPVFNFVDRLFQLKNPVIFRPFMSLLGAVTLDA
jgi:hypothetical protein